jgi:hypothetical protein
MKRLITAVSFAVLAVPALAQNGKPFEQLDLERALPEVQIAADEARSVDSRSLPYEQAQVDRELPSFDTGRVHLAAESPWANDWNFIAPAL